MRHLKHELCVVSFVSYVFVVRNTKIENFDPFARVCTITRGEFMQNQPFATTEILFLSTIGDASRGREQGTGLSLKNYRILAVQRVQRAFMTLTLFRLVLSKSLCPMEILILKSLSPSSFSR